MQFMSLEEAVQLIQLEFAEMPTLKLTFWQAQRLWNLSEELCERSLRTLLASGFLERTRDGLYMRGPGAAAAVTSLPRAM